jgi:hypothetical protein
MALRTQMVQPLRVVYLSILFLGIFFAFLFSYFTTVPFVPVEARVIEKRYMLLPPQNSTHARYEFSFDDIMYQGDAFYPSSFFSMVNVGDKIIVYYHLIDPAYNAPVSITSSPIIIVCLGLSLLAIIFCYFRKVS